MSCFMVFVLVVLVGLLPDIDAQLQTLGFGAAVSLVPQLYSHLNGETGRCLLPVRDELALGPGQPWRRALALWQEVPEGPVAKRTIERHVHSREGVTGDRLVLLKQTGRVAAAHQTLVKRHAM